MIKAFITAKQWEDLINGKITENDLYPDTVTAIEEKYPRELWRLKDSLEKEGWDFSNFVNDNEPLNISGIRNYILHTTKAIGQLNLKELEDYEEGILAIGGDERFDDYMHNMSELYDIITARSFDLGFRLAKSFYDTKSGGVL